MKWNLIKASVLTLLGLSAEHNTKLDLSAEEKTKVNKLASGGKEPEGDMAKFADVFAEKFNKEIEALADNANAQKIYEDFLAENKIDPAPSGEKQDGQEVSEGIVPDADAKTLTQAMQQLVKTNASLAQKNQKLAADNEKLKALPEDDVPELVIEVNPNNLKAVKHSKTHLFASGQSWDSIDRPWNKNVLDAQNGTFKPSAATVWNKVNIDKLNEDLGAYSRRNPNEIMSLLMDGYSIPANWFVISNIQDQQVFASIATGEVTQSFKKAWLPKNKQRFVPIINKIFDKQIDITWEPSELKSIEKSWLNMFFNEGSTPYKEGFARFLISELVKKARKEDKITVFNGVYSDPQLNPETPGSFMNAMNGFLKVIDGHRDVNYKAFETLGEPTETNIYDYINDFVKLLPYDYRIQPGIVIGMSHDLHKAYHNARELKKGTNTDYSMNDTTVDQYPNISFVAHPQFGASKFIYSTTSDNIGLMVDRPGEEDILTMEKDKRAINVFGDYKLGVAVKALGAAVDPDAPLTYENQIFFSNKSKVLEDVYVPIAADDTTPSVLEHNALKIGSNNTAARDITKLDDVVEGTYYYLYGDQPGTFISTIKNNANIILDGGDFALNNGNLLVVIGQADGKVLEYSRTVASAVPSFYKVVLDADATTADAVDGTYFVTQANTAATAFTNIENAVKDEVYTIEGGSATNSTTIANGGKFFLNGGTFTASVGATLKVVYNGSKFVELSRA